MCDLTKEELAAIARWLDELFDYMAGWEDDETKGDEVRSLANRVEAIVSSA